MDVFVPYTSPFDTVIRRLGLLLPPLLRFDPVQVIFLREKNEKIIFG